MELTWYMSAKKHHICLSHPERRELEKISRSNHRSVREKTRARILLLCDGTRSREEGGSAKDDEVAQHVGCTPWTVGQLRRRACERGVLNVVGHAEQERRKARKLDGRQEAILVAVTCSAPPTGQGRWTLKLLRERLIEMEVVTSIGQETVRQTLKKTHLSRG